MQDTYKKRIELAKKLLEKIDEIRDILKDEGYPEQMHFYMTKDYLQITNDYKIKQEVYDGKFIDVVRTKDKTEVLVDGDGLYKRMPRM